MPQGPYPEACACDFVISVTLLPAFFVVRQPGRWYLLPVGVMTTVSSCPESVAAGACAGAAGCSETPLDPPPPPPEPIPWESAPESWLAASMVPSVAVEAVTSLPFETTVTVP